MHGWIYWECVVSVKGYMGRGSRSGKRRGGGTCGRLFGHPPCVGCLLMFVGFWVIGFEEFKWL